MGSIIAETFCDFHRSRQKNADNLSTIHVRGDLMSDNDHLDEQWLWQTPPPRRRSGAGCGLTLLLVLLLVLAGAVFYPRIRARLTPVQTVQIQRESSVLPEMSVIAMAAPKLSACDWMSAPRMKFEPMPVESAKGKFV